MNLADRTPLILRLAGVTALVGILFTHVIGTGDAFDEAFWVGVGYTAIDVACLVCAVALLMPSPTEQRRGWLFGGLTALFTLVAYALTRTTGLPQMREELGNWSEKYAVWSTIAEGSMIVLAGYALLSHRGHGPDTADQLEP